MNAPSSSDIVLVGARGTINGKPNHGGNHLTHLKDMGILSTVVDVLPLEQPQDTRTTHFQGTIQDYLKSGEATPKGVLISTPDTFHITDLIACIEAGVLTILVEKPIAMNPEEWKKFQEIMAVAKKQQQTIMSCLPRLMDIAYIHLEAMIPEFINLYGKIRTISHSFAFHKDVNTGSAGRDHLAHEITMVMKLLGYTGEVGNIDIHVSHDSSDKYECHGFIDGKHFIVSGNKKSDTPHERVIIGFERGQLTLDAKSGKLVHSGGKIKDTTIEVGASNPTSRLFGVTKNFIEKSLGSDGISIYLPENLLLASAQLPAILRWSNEPTAS